MHDLYSCKHTFLHNQCWLSPSPSYYTPFSCPFAIFPFQAGPLVYVIPVSPG